MGCCGSKSFSKEKTTGRPLATSTPRTTKTSLKVAPETASTVSRTPVKFSGEALCQRQSQLCSASRRKQGGESSSRISPVGINSPNFERVVNEESFQNGRSHRSQGHRLRVSPEPSRKLGRTEPGSVKAVRKEAQVKNKAERVLPSGNGRRLNFEPKQLDDSSRDNDNNDDSEP